MPGTSSSAAKAALFVVGFGAGLGIGLGLGRAGAGDAAAPTAAWNSERPARGPANAPVTVVEFMDYQCPACRLFHRATYDSLLSEYGDRIRYEVRHFPLENIHPNAMASARAAICAHQQGRFWEFHDELFGRENSDLSRDTFLGRAEALSLDLAAFESCLDSDLSSDMVAGDFLTGISRGVRSTPTLFVNDSMLAGAQPLDTIRRAIDAALSRASRH